MLSRSLTEQPRFSHVGCSLLLRCTDRPSAFSSNCYRTHPDAECVSTQPERCSNRLIVLLPFSKTVCCQLYVSLCVLCTLPGSDCSTLSSERTVVRLVCVPVRYTRSLLPSIHRLTLCCAYRSVHLSIAHSVIRSYAFTQSTVSTAYTTIHTTAH